MIQRRLLAALIIVFILSQFSWNVEPAWAQTQGPRRTTEITIDVDLYEWWLILWRDNSIRCRIIVDHDGLPTAREISRACTQKDYQTWLETLPCNEVDITRCKGVYLFQASRGRGQRTINLDLPPSEVWISLGGCSEGAFSNQCNDLPYLLLSGLEPLPNETIVRIQGTIDGEPFSCRRDLCRIPLRPTGRSGIQIEFWADSSFGDSSEDYTALVRVIPWGDFMAPEGPRNDPRLYYVDVISSQWEGQRAASCSATWQSFPDVGEPPEWLRTPEAVAELTSSVSFYYLAGMLIRNGAVDARTCSNGGMANNVVANSCGVQLALPQVRQWQNRFDADILQVAVDTGVPAQLMKNIFARESQFWPGIYRTYREAGLGQLTNNGADTILLWNDSFYAQFCPLVLSQEACETRFTHLDERYQAMLRGALVQQVNAACVDCEAGIDLSQARFSVNIFAHALIANCEQVTQVFWNLTRQFPGRMSSYNDLWRFTLVNYNAGAGCLYRAVQRAWLNREPLDWEHVAPYLEPACQGAIRYVESITGHTGPSLYTGDDPNLLSIDPFATDDTFVDEGDEWEEDEFEEDEDQLPEE
ncbi:MAG TPA: hypothetical protein VLH85_03625 [Levilinea sp.]|nr:hypothetical protein [Levilinea sp.]